MKGIHRPCMHRIHRPFNVFDYNSKITKTLFFFVMKLLYCYIVLFHTVVFDAVHSGKCISDGLCFRRMSIKLK